MKQSIVIAQVGTSSYRETEYESMWNGKKVRTKSFYSFEAVAKEALRQTGADELQIVLFGTVDSALGSMLCENVFSAETTFKSDKLNIETIHPNPKNQDIVYQRINNITEKEAREEFEKEMSRRLTNHFREESRENGYADVNVKLTLSIIEYGVDDQQLSQNFELINTTVSSVINPRADVDFYFDISNGFRSFPIYLYTLMNYLSRIEQRKYYLSEKRAGEIKANQNNIQSVEIESEKNTRNIQFHLYYGMFDAAKTYYVDYRKQRNPEDSIPNITPLINLQTIDNLMLLINGINEFRTCGSVIQICYILESHPNWDIVIGKSRNNKPVRLSDTFQLFSYGTNGNNLAALEESVHLLKEMSKVIADNTTIDIGEKLLLKDISEDFSKRFDYSKSKCPYTKFMLQLAKWYLDQQRNGSAAIAAQESIVTYFMECYPDQVNAYLRKENPKKHKDSYDFKNTEYLFEYSLRDSVKTVLDKNHGKKDADEDKDKEEDCVRKFLDIYRATKSDVRNIMAHISYMPEAYISTGLDQPYKLEDKQKKIEDLINVLLNEVKAVDEGQGEGPLGMYFSNRLMVVAGNMEDQEELKRKEELLTRMLEGIEQETGTSETAIGKLLYEKQLLSKDEYDKKLDELKKQIEIMKNSKSFESFYAQKESLGLLFMVMEAWIRESKTLDSGSKEKPGIEEYKSFYMDKKDRKKNRTRKGHERLTAYMKSRAGEMVKLIESA